MYDPLFQYLLVTLGLLAVAVIAVAIAYTVKGDVNNKIINHRDDEK